MGIFCPIGGQSIFEKFIRWYDCSISSFTLQWLGVHCSKVITVLFFEIELILVFIIRLMSKYWGLLLRSRSAIEIANMNLGYPLIWVSTSKESTSSSTVFRDQTMFCFSNVLNITLVNIAKNAIIMATEQKAPVIVRYSGSLSYLRNSEVANTSHFKKRSLIFYLQLIIMLVIIIL